MLKRTEIIATFNDINFMFQHLTEEYKIRTAKQISFHLFSSSSFRRLEHGQIIQDLVEKILL